MFDFEVCVYCSRNDIQSAKALIDAGADVNGTNFNSVSPVVTAAALGHSQVLKYLVTVPGVNLNAQVRCKCDLSLTWSMHVISM